MEEKQMYGMTHKQWIKSGGSQAEWDNFFAMLEAFDAVKDREHWKNPINAIIDADKRDITEQAIIHFAGGGIVFTPVRKDPTKLRVRAPGYWANGF